MPEPVVLIAAFAGFGLVVLAVSRLNDGSPIDIGGIFPVHGRRDWPRGVQEGDVPHFEVHHLDALRPADEGGGDLTRGLSNADPRVPQIERVPTNVRRLAPRH